MSGADSNETIENEDEYLQDDYEKENYVSIQDYTGEGYTLYDANEEYGEIAEENRETVVSAVENYFKDQYSSEVEVHNIVSAKDGVTVFVESLGEPHFNTIAIVPIDLESREIKADSVWSREGEVEYAIKSGLYAMAFKEEFAKLDDYLESVTEEYDVIGAPIEVVRNVKGHGYSTPFYFVATGGDVFEQLYEKYVENPEITEQEIVTFFEEHTLEPENVNVNIEFFMEDSGTEPSEDIFSTIVADMENMEGIPTGGYSISLNDNYIDKTRGESIKESSLERTFPEQIMKE